MLKALKFKTGFYVKKTSACTLTIRFRQVQVLSINCLHHLFFFGLQNGRMLHVTQNQLRQRRSFELRCSLDLFSSYQKD